ncbi:hypothetical protein ScalyP_jg11543 [Parmales sp. scaly parma]|nr:hypothetical protein ScalyP_jg11543 [Parmales sp. scaly parma]
MVKEAILTLIKLDLLFLKDFLQYLLVDQMFQEATMLLRAVWKLMREVHERNANENSNDDAADDEFVLVCPVCPKKHKITEKTKGPNAFADCGICKKKKLFRNSKSYYRCQKCDFKCCSDECYEKGKKRATDKTILQRLTTAVNSLITGSRSSSLQNDDDGIDEKSELGKHKKVCQDVFEHIRWDPIFYKSTATTCAKHFKYHVS